MNPLAFVTCFKLIGARGNDANDEETAVHADHTQRMKSLQVVVSLAIGTMLELL